MGRFFRDNYDDDTIRVDDLKDASKQFTNIVQKMTGHGGDVRSAITQSASEFSELVADDIKTQGQYDEQKWRDASANCMVGTWITDLWVKNVENFRKELDEIQKEWDSFPPRPGPTATASDPNNPTSIPRYPSSSSTVGNWPGAPWVSYDTAKENKLRELIKQAEKAQEDFEEEAKQRKNDLETGVDDEVIKRLTDAGVVGWGAYNILGPTQPIPLPVNKESGKKYAEKLKKGIEDGTLADCDYEELVLILNALGKKSAEHQGTGKGLSKDEKAFIDAVNSKLETLDPVPVPPGTEGEAHNIYRSPGVLSLPDHLEMLDVPEDDQKAILGAIGGGILVASDTRLGGGYDDVPASVKNAVEGSGRYEYPGKIDNWAHDTYRLSQLLQHAPEKLQGGTGFSAGLTTTIGVELEKNGGNFFHFDSHAGSEPFQNVIERTTLNKNANYLILTGNYESSSLTDDDITKALKGLYSYNWKDDGKALAGLTDWIAEDSDEEASDSSNYRQVEDAEKTRRIAAEAAIGFIERITDESMHEAIETNDSFSDFFGSGFGEANPELSKSMLSIFESYINDFGRDSESEHFNFYSGEEDDPLSDNGEYISIPAENRVNFMQLIASDEDSAKEMYTDIKNHQATMVETYFEASGSDELDDPHAVTGGNSGRLKGLFDSAVYNEGFRRFGDQRAAEDYLNTIGKVSTQAFVDQLVGEIPYVGGSTATLIKGGTDYFWDHNPSKYEAVEDALKSGEASYMNDGEMRTELEIKLQMLNHLKENGEIGKDKIHENLTNGEYSVSGLEGLPKIPEELKPGRRDQAFGNIDGSLGATGFKEEANEYVKFYNGGYEESEDLRRKGED
ncbi:hypothetical protein [Nocardiopsis rhodophaea]|uniref:TPR repeat region-containing protein n=1 Tax=Nocardiopsis rhodophaea TaxID=280238 RepID=UPI0031D6E7AC